MTRDEAMKLDAGPELDTFIATKLMGWQLFPYIMPGVPDWQQCYCPPGVRVNASTIKEVPKFSSDIAAAFHIWPMLYKRWGSVALCQDPGGMWTCMDHDGIGATYGYGPTECVALCRAGIAEFFAGRD